MSWEDIIKAPTSNRNSRFGYSGNRGYSSIDDKMMKDIVKGVGLPETKENGEKIEYDEEEDFNLVPFLRPLGNNVYEYGIKFEGELHIWAEDASNPAHTFTAEDIEYESSIIEINNEERFSLDYEFSQYHGGKIYLDVFVENSRR